MYACVNVSVCVCKCECECMCVPSSTNVTNRSIFFSQILLLIGRIFTPAVSKIEQNLGFTHFVFYYTVIL